MAGAGDASPVVLLPICAGFDGLFALVAGTGKSICIASSGDPTKMPTRDYHLRLRITTRTNGGLVEVLFSDNGPGIEEANLSKIFTPFFTTLLTINIFCMQIDALTGIG